MDTATNTCCSLTQDFCDGVGIAIFALLVLWLLTLILSKESED